MTFGHHLRRLMLFVARAVDSIAWYYRARPDAERRVAALLVFSAMLTLWSFVAWGVLGVVVALVVVGAFVVFIVPFIEEIRSLAEGGVPDIELDLRNTPWFNAPQEEDEEEDEEAASLIEFRAPAELGTPGELQAPADLHPPDDEARPLLTLPRPERDRRDVPARALDPEPDAPREGESDSRITARMPDASLYELRAFADGAYRTLYRGTSLLETSDQAFEFIEEHDPAEVVIVRIAGEAEETMWAYKRSESAVERGRVSTSDIFGFDASLWRTSQLRAARQTSHPGHRR
jgi:hypothetical protein